MTDEHKRTGAPGGGQSDAAAGQPGPTETAAAAVADMTEEEARKAFPKQVEAAIRYAEDNKYDYGPKLRRLELDYTVISARSMSDDITRVVLAYRPKNRFKGESGREYLDVDQSGAIQARRQIRPVKESMPWLLIGLAAVSVIAAAILVPLITLVDETADPTYVSGRTLWIRSDQPRVGNYLTYDANDTDGVPRTWIIVPEGEGTDIAWVELTVINQTSGVVSLAIDSDAVELTLDSGIIVRPINVVERVLWPAEGERLDPRLEIAALPMWGDRVLEAGQQIQGFMAFEVPDGSSVRALRWDATDVANIRY